MKQELPDEEVELLYSVNQGSVAPKPAIQSTDDLLISECPTTDKGFYRDTNLF